MEYTTKFRLSAIEIKLIDRGLDIVRYYGSDLNLPAYDRELSAEVGIIAQTVRDLARRPPAKMHRVTLDAAAIAVCMFAVRSFVRELRRGDIPNLAWPDGVDRERLFTKLEKHRKRAKRKWLRRGDPAVYEEWCRRWRRFLGWVRDGRKPLRILSLPNYYVRNLDWVFANVKRTLNEETNEQLPEDRQLRKLTRVMLRHVRRERAPVTVKDLLVCNEAARCFISQFMMRLIAKQATEKGSENSADPLLQSLQTV